MCASLKSLRDRCDTDSTGQFQFLGTLMVRDRAVNSAYSTLWYGRSSRPWGANFLRLVVRTASILDCQSSLSGGSTRISRQFMDN